MVKINGIEIKQKSFLFDGCHKIYLLEGDYVDEALKCGYDLDNDIYPIEKIHRVFWNTCPLRFIETFNDFKKIVPQCESVVEFEIDGKKIIENFETNEITEKII